MSHFAIVGDRGCLEPFLIHLAVTNPLLTILPQLFDRSDYEAMDKAESVGRLIQVGQDPEDFLDSILTGQMAIVVRYEEARDPSWSNLWPYLRREMSIIHVKRRNLFALHVMRSRGKPPFYFDPDLLERDLITLTEARREHDLVLQYGQVCDFWYEDLQKNLIATLGLLGSFLDQEISPMWYGPEERKIGPTLVENYTDIRRHFVDRGHPFAEYFDA